MTAADASRAELLARLRGCIGHRLVWEGETLELQDILPAEALLVLRAVDAGTALQADQHGDPRRRAPVLRELPALSDDGACPSEIAEALLRGLPERH